MAVKKLSVALDPEIAAAAAADAARRGISLSAWLTEAAAHALKIADGLAAVAEYEAEYGAFTAEELAEAAAWLDGTDDRAGVDGPR